MTGAAAFSCPPDCGWCCTHLERGQGDEERAAAADFHDAMRALGVYTCGDDMTRGLSLSNDEARALHGVAQARGLRADIHPRTFLLETRRRLVVTLDWHLAHASCPFYADYKCTAYEARPLVCRAYPLMVPSPKWSLAPECPRAAPTMEARAAGALRLGSFLRVESRARRELDAAHARLDDAAMRLLDRPELRFARGWAAARAHERATTWRAVAPENILS